MSTFSDLLYKKEIEERCLKYCKAYRINAYTASELMPSTREYTDAEINQILKENAIDGVLMIAMQDYWESNYYVPQYGSKTTGSATVIGNTISYTQQKQNYGGYSFSKPRIVFESRFFDFEKSTFVWRATSITRGNAFADFSILAENLTSEVTKKLYTDLNFRIRYTPPAESQISDIEIVKIDKANAERELNSIEKIFENREYNEAMFRLGYLDKCIQQSPGLENKEKYLFRINLIWGACFIEGKNRLDIGRSLLAKAVEYNPELEIDRGLSDAEMIQLYEELLGKKIPFEGKQKEPEVVSNAIETEKRRIKYSAGDLVRVIKADAILRLEPDEQSEIIKRLPLGAQVEVIEDMESWVKVQLPQTNEGIVIVGFIRKSLIKI
jgi:hypothetical protein